MVGRSFETPKKFYDHVVRPNIGDWEKNPQELRLAFNAVISVDAFAGHILEYKKDLGEFKANLQDKDYKKTLSQESRSFCIVTDVAKAQKHVRLKNKTAVVKNATDTKLGKIDFGLGAYGSGPYNGDRVVSVVEEQNRPLLDDCKSAANYLLTLLEE